MGNDEHRRWLESPYTQDLLALLKTRREALLPNRALVATRYEDVTFYRGAVEETVVIENRIRSAAPRAPRGSHE